MKKTKKKKYTRDNVDAAATLTPAGQRLMFEIEKIYKTNRDFGYPVTQIDGTVKNSKEEET